jgi:hypothetical protein
MKKALFILFTAAVLVLLPAPSVLADYNPSAERAFDGTVASVPRMFDRIMYFSFKTSDRVVEVQLGPRDFVENNKFKLKTGEMVTVVGVTAILGKQEVLLARELRTVNAVFTIRDRNGAPLWDTDRPVQMDVDVDESGEPVMCKRIEP